MSNSVFMPAVSLRALEFDFQSPPQKRMKIDINS